MAKPGRLRLRSRGLGRFAYLSLDLVAASLLQLSVSPSFSFRLSSVGWYFAYYRAFQPRTMRVSPFSRLQCQNEATFGATGSAALRTCLHSSLPRPSSRPPFLVRSPFQSSVRLNVFVLRPYPVLSRASPRI
jgi:uncharacterized Zn-finger protein